MIILALVAGAVVITALISATFYLVSFISLERVDKTTWDIAGSRKSFINSLKVAAIGIAVVLISLFTSH